MSDRRGTMNTDRFPPLGDERGRRLCRMCRCVLTGRKRSFCGLRCLRDFFMQTDWQRVRRVVYERDGHRCMECGAWLNRGAFHVDHIIPLAAGGVEWDLSNLELLCPTCNLRKGAQTEAQND